MRFKDNKNQDTVLLAMPLRVMCLTAAFPKYCNGTAHNGIDLRGAVGTPVYAAEDGTARWVQKWDGKTKTGNMSYGNAVILLHNNYQGGKLETVYAHLNALNVKQGQTVKEGDIIGWVGNTGNSFGAHLHFEVRYKGVKVQPLYWLGDNFTWASDAVRKSSGAYTSVKRNVVAVPTVTNNSKADTSNFEVGLEVQKMSGGDKEKVISLLDELKLKYKEV